MSMSLEGLETKAYMMKRCGECRASCAPSFAYHLAMPKTMMTADKALSVSLEARLDAVLEVIEQVERHLHAHGAGLTMRHMLTVAIETVLHDRIAHAPSGTADARIEVRLDCEEARIRCEIIDNGKAFEHSADSGPIVEVLKAPGIELASTSTSSASRVTITYNRHRTAGNPNGI